jgi:hypothetical protein
VGAFPSCCLQSKHAPVPSTLQFTEVSEKQSLKYLFRRVGLCSQTQEEPVGDVNETLVRCPYRDYTQ